MKRFFSLNVRSVLLASTLALAVIPAAAQTPSSTAPGDTSAGYTTRTDVRDDGTDWGWIGLLGLTGLLGLIPKRQRVEADYRATDTSRATAR